MRKPEVAPTTDTKVSRVRQGVERTAKTPEAQGPLIPRHIPLADLASAADPPTPEAVHLAMLNDAMASGPSHAAQSLLRLQRQYGNHYVRRVVALARQTDGEGEAAPEVEQGIQRARGGGQPLDSRTRAQMEPALGADFSRVRVHIGAEADALNHAVNARAFTTGQDIFFREGEYSPGSSTGRKLLAHELTHVVQQTGDKLQAKLMIGRPADAYEQEADQVAEAVMRAPDPARQANGPLSTVAPLQRSAATRVDHDEQMRRQYVPVHEVAPRIQRQDGLLGDLREGVLGRLAGWAREIPGFDLLTVILGRDPITERPVERNAANLIRGVLSLIPGGAAMFENLQRSGALQRTFDWFNQEIQRLNLTWETIRGLFRAAWDALSWRDLADPGGAWNRIRGIFGPPLARIRDFAVAAGRKVAEFIFEGVLGGQGGVGAQILGIIRRAGNAFSAIINDPIGFVGNLIRAVRGGFERFASNIGEHLRTGITGWLFGALAGTLRLPERFDLAGIVSIVLQVLGLTYQRLRGMLVRLLGEERVVWLERTFEFLQMIATRGLAAAWERIVEFAGNLTDMVLGAIRDWVSRSIVGAAITRLISMFNPAGAIIQAIIAIYNTIQFFIERAQQIATLANAVFDSITTIASGNLGAAIAYVEQTMARTLPVIISFLARLIGLGDIATQIKNIIQRIQGVVETAINRVVNWIGERVRRLLPGGEESRPATRAPVTPPTGAPTEVTPAWERGVEGVMQGLAALEEREADEETVRAQLPVWQRTYGFTSLTLENTDDQWVINGRMNPSGAVTRQPKVNQAAIKAAAGYDGLTFQWDEMGAQVDQRFTAAQNRRRTSVVGHLEDIRPTGEERTGNIRVNTLPGWEEGDVAGHLIGHQFYGANYDRDNFVPMRRDVNHPTYYTLFEAKMATWMREQKRKHRAWLVQISIRAEYNDSRVGRQRMRPVSFSVAAVGITGHRAPSGAVVLTREPLARETIPNPRP